MDKPRHKRGDVREDGKVFWASYKGNENWLSQDQFARRKERHRNYYHSNPEIQRSASLKATYGITHEQYSQLLEKQGGVCGICGVTKCPTGRHFCVDHDHATGNVRGILCSRCNHAIGLLKDNANFLKKGIDYLRRSSCHGRQGVASATL